MALSKFAFDPENGFEDSSVFPDPKDETETREQLMELHRQTQDYLNGTVYTYMNLLNSLTEDDIETVVDAVKGTTKTYTLLSTGWTDGVYTISDELITTTSNQRLTLNNPTTAQYNAAVSAILVDGGQTTGSLSIKSVGTVPTVDIPVAISYHGEASA